MVTFEDIRRGLAANLTAVPGFHVFLYLMDDPRLPALQVAGLRTVDYDIEFHTPSGSMEGHRLTVVIEAAVSKGSNEQAQKTLDQLHSDKSVKAAIEADDQLTSRLSDSGTVVTDQPAACDALRVVSYDLNGSFTLNSGVEVALATWDVDILV